MKTYQEALKESNGQKLTYSSLLSLQEWKAKRTEVERRENNVCEKCGKTCADDYIPLVVGSLVIEKPAAYEEVEIEVDITDPHTGEVIDSYFTPSIQLVVQDNPRISHVHHTYYILDKLPWEYPNESLMLVCHVCHEKIHQEEVIRVYKDERQKDFSELTPCSRCNGTGHLYEFDYYKNGVCFRCNGAGFDELI